MGLFERGRDRDTWDLRPLDLQPEVDRLRRQLDRLRAELEYERSRNFENIKVSGDHTLGVYLDGCKVTDEIERLSGLLSNARLELRRAQDARDSFRNELVAARTKLSRVERERDAAHQATITFLPPADWDFSKPIVLQKHDTLRLTASVTVT